MHFITCISRSVLQKAKIVIFFIHTPERCIICRVVIHVTSKLLNNYAYKIHSSKTV